MFDSSVWVVLHGHSFLGIIGCNVFKYFLLGQWLPIFSVSCQPKSWSLGVEVISDTQVILPDLNDKWHSSCFDLFGWILRFLYLLGWLSEYIFIITIIYINNVVLSWLIIVSCRYDLRWLTISILVNIHYIFSSSSCLTLWVSSFSPSITYILF